MERERDIQSKGLNFASQFVFAWPNALIQDTMMDSSSRDTSGLTATQLVNTDKKGPA